MNSSNKFVTVADIDSTITSIQTRFPEVNYVSISRVCYSDEFTYEVRAVVPRRDISHRLMRNQTHPLVCDGGENLSTCLDRFEVSYHYYKTGKLLTRDEK